MLVRSATCFSSSITSGFLSTGKDSPVKGDSSTFSSMASRIRASAGMRSPASTVIRSPGTRFSASISSSRPSLITLASILSSFLRAFIDCCAWNSIQKPMIVLTSRTTKIAIPSGTSPKTKASTAAAVNKYITGLLTWEIIRSRRLRSVASLSLLGP